MLSFWRVQCRWRYLVETPGKTHLGSNTCRFSLTNDMLRRIDPQINFTDVMLHWTMAVVLLTRTSEQYYNYDISWSSGRFMISFFIKDRNPSSVLQCREHKENKNTSQTQSSYLISLKVEELRKFKVSVASWRGRRHQARQCAAQHTYLRHLSPLFPCDSLYGSSVAT